jgi:hypothetical protein
MKKTKKGALTNPKVNLELAMQIIEVGTPAKVVEKPLIYEIREQWEDKLIGFEGPVYTPQLQNISFSILDGEKESMLLYITFYPNKKEEIIWSGPLTDRVATKQVVSYTMSCEYNFGCEQKALCLSIRNAFIERFF